MDAHTKAIYRLMFHAKLAKLTGMAYQNFFTQVMSYASSDFLAIKPQGQEGDWKNDGHEPTAGRYYQVYSPEQFLDETKMVAKVEEDFDGLIAKWGDAKIYPNGVKEFFFVFNDALRVTPGGYPTTIKKLEDLRKKHNLQRCGLFLQGQLEDKLLGLPEDKIIAVLGFPPDPASIRTLNLQSVNEIIIHIVENTQPRSLVQSLISPDFEEKIVFNGLALTGGLLRDANYRVGTLEEYFRANSSFTRQDVRDRLRAIYEDSCRKLNSEGVALTPDEMLFHILNEVCPTPPSGNQRLHKEMQDAALVVMAYFFESCDIFEEPGNVDAR